MPTTWEDEVFSDPDGVELDALFEDLHSDDERTQYEAAAGVYWLADLRPERAWSRADDLLVLLGNLPKFGLGDATSGTRDWVARAVGELVAYAPNLFLPEVADRFTANDEATREDATRALAFASGGVYTKTVPSELLEYQSLLGDLLTDPNPAVRANALTTLAGIAGDFPDEIAPLSPDVYPFLDHNEAVSSAALFTKNVGDEHPESVEPLVEQLARTLNRINEDDLLTTKSVLEALLAVTDSYPDAIESEMEEVEQLAHSPHPPASRPASKVLRKLRE